MFLVSEIIGILAINLILVNALGTSTLFIAAGSRRNLIGTAAVITLFTTAGAVCAYLINSVTDGRFEKFSLLFYTLAVGIIYILSLTLLYFAARKHFEASKKYIHLSAYNCAVMGTLFTITQNEALQGRTFTLSEYLLFGFEAGIGFIIAAMILTVAYKRLNSSSVPGSFRGFPAMLIYLGIISMAVYSLK